MKLAKIVLIFLEVLLAASLAFGQNTSIGLRTGASYFTLRNDEINEDALHTMGLNIAIPIEFSVTSTFSIQPELHFIQKGVAFEELIDGQDLRQAIKTNYLELPVLLKANFGTEKFSYYAFIAPSIGYATNRYMTEKLGDTDKVKTAVDFIEGDIAQSQRWEFSTIGGIGGAIKAGQGSIVLDIRYHLGLTDNTKFEVDKPDDWEKTTNRGCTLSVGYMVPFGGK